VTVSYSFGFNNIGLVYPGNSMNLSNNVENGTTTGVSAYSSTTPETAASVYATFSGTGTVVDSAIYFNGILLHDITSAGAYTVSTDIRWNNIYQDSLFTVIIAAQGTGNVTVDVDDGTVIRAFTCNMGATYPAENIFYFATAAAADKFRVRVNVSAETVYVTMPTVLRGIQSTLQYKDQR
jgi:hypothetical protein